MDFAVIGVTLIVVLAFDFMLENVRARREDRGPHTILVERLIPSQVVGGPVLTLGTSVTIERDAGRVYSH